MGLCLLRVEAGGTERDPELPGPGGVIKECSRALWRAGTLSCLLFPFLRSSTLQGRRGGVCA